MLGSVVRLVDGSLWRVLSLVRLTKTCRIANFSEKREVAQEDVQVVSNPPSDWPYANPSYVATNKSPIIQVFRGNKLLTPLEEWVPSDFNRQGSVFFNPNLKLRKGEVLTAVCANKRNLRLVITPSFGTVSCRIKKTPVKKNNLNQSPKEDWEDLI